jgi:hypothetical protein
VDDALGSHHSITKKENTMYAFVGPLNYCLCVSDKNLQFMILLSLFILSSSFSSPTHAVCTQLKIGFGYLGIRKNSLDVLIFFYVLPIF